MVSIHMTGTIGQECGRVAQPGVCQHSGNLVEHALDEEVCSYVARGGVPSRHVLRVVEKTRDVTLEKMHHL